MTPIDRTIRMLAAFALALLSLASVSVNAQSTSSSTRVMVGLLETPLSDHARALLVRTAGGTQMDLILLSPGPDADISLGGALSLLQRLRRTEPVARRTSKITIQGSTAPLVQTRAVRSSLSRKLARRDAGVARDLGSYGRALVFMLPNANVRRD